MVIGDSLSLFPGGYQTQLSGHVTNISKVGRSTYGMVQVLNENKGKIRNQDIVVIYGGINDIYGGTNEYNVINNIQKMVNIVNENEGHPVLILGYNPLNVHHNKTKALKYHNLQNLLKYKITGVKCIVPVFDGIDKSCVSGDGIHLNSKGNILFTKHVLKHI